MKHFRLLKSNEAPKLYDVHTLNCSFSFESSVTQDSSSSEFSYLRNRFVLAVICCLIYHCQEVSRLKWIKS